MAFCSNCGNQVDDGAKFCPKCGKTLSGSFASQQQPMNQGYQQPQYATQSNTQSQPLKPDSNMVMAILSTIFCCLPTGIYAIILANKVDGLYYSGRYVEAEEAANGAKKWSIIGGVIAIIGILLYIVFIVVAAAAGASGFFR